MKRIALLVLTLVLTAGNIAFAQENKDVDKVISEVMDEISNIFGDKEKFTYSISRNPESNAIISEVDVRPFHSGQQTVEEAIQRLLSTFEQNKGLAYNYAHILPRAGQAISTCTGDDKESTFCILEGPDASYQLVFMEIKDGLNPQHRNFYGIKWRNLDNETDGVLYRIHSRRPDLIFKDAEHEGDISLSSVMSNNGASEINTLQKLSKYYDSQLVDVMKRIAEAKTRGWLSVANEYTRELQDIQQKRKEILDKIHSLIMLKMQ